MSAIIRVTVSGDQEVIRMLRAIGSQIDEKLINPYINDYANQLRSEMVRREHVITGRMRNSTQVVPLSNGKQVVVDVPYANDENRRIGVKVSKSGEGRGTPHNFLEPALAATENIKDMEFIFRLASFLRTV